jgi:hypothetical protein
MLQTVLPMKAYTIKPIGLLASWLQLPLANSSIDIVIGDGCFSSLAAHDYADMSKEISRILKFQGILIMRFFVKSMHDSIELIKNDFLLKKINNFHAFKLRLAIALHTNLQQGICLKKIWDVWSQEFKDLAIHNGEWSKEIIDTIDNYKDSNVVYTFPSLNEIRSTLQFDFNELELFTPHYTLGECCLSLKLKPKKVYT